MAKYWALSKGNVLGPFSAEEIICLPDFNPEIPVCFAEGGSANWVSAGNIPEIVAALKHPASIGSPSASGEGLPGSDKSADAGLRPSESEKLLRYAVTPASRNEMVQSLESIESRITRIDRWLEHREEIVDEVAQRILDFHRLFSKHLNALRDQWDQERSQFRGAVEERIDKRAIQLEDALCKAGQTQSLLNEALGALEAEKEGSRAFIAESLYTDLKKKFLGMKDELLQVAEKTGEELGNSIRQRMEDFSHRLESRMSAMQELESKIRPKQHRLEELVEREESLNRMLESGLRRVYPLEKQEGADEASDRFRNKASADIFFELEQRLRRTKKLGENLNEYFTGLRSGWEKDKDGILEKMSAGFKSLESDLKAMKFANEDYRESTKKYHSQIDELTLIHDRISELLKGAGPAIDRQKQEWEATAKESLSRFYDYLGVRLKEWENTLAGRLKSWEGSVRGEIGEITKSIQERADADMKKHISNVSEPLEKLTERIENLEQQFAKRALDVKTEIVRSELPVVIGRVGDSKDKESPVPEQLPAGKWKFKNNFVIIAILLTLLAALAVFFLSH